MSKEFKITSNVIIKAFFASLVFALTCFGGFLIEAGADQISYNAVSTDGSTLADVTDDDEYTYESFHKDTEITITADDAIVGIYIKWEYAPGEWILKAGDEEITCGTHGFIHEYVDFAKSLAEVTSFTIVIPADETYINDIYVFSAGSLPDWVQVWEEPYDEADLLCIAGHADDDILWFGPMMISLINQGGVRVQVAYFCEFYSTGQSYRNHELLEGLWTMGITHYPQLGEFSDDYSESLEAAEELYDMDAAREYIVRTIRRFKPQVVVTHDLDGEYGHGTHMLVANLVCEAVDGICADAGRYTDSADRYGVWDVPKTYLHLYDENKISIDVTEPLGSFGGKDAVEVADEAYACHLSQQWTDFKVSTETDSSLWGNYERPCTEFGLYRSTVGADTGNDVLENIVTYDEQEAAAALESAGEEGAESAENAGDDSKGAAAGEDNTAKPSSFKKFIKWIIIIFAVIICVLIITAAYISGVRRKRRRRRELEERMRARRQALNSRYESGQHCARTKALARRRY